MEYIYHLSEENIRKPLVSRIEVMILVLIGVMILLFVLMNAGIILTSVSENGKGFINLGLVAGIVLSMTWFFLQIVGKIFVRYMVTSTRKEAEARSTWKIVSYIIWALVIIGLLFGVISDPNSWAIILGLFAAAMAFVLQQPLLNIVGWLFISTRSIYRIGDRVSIAGVNGYVIDISTIQTQIREFGDWMAGDTFTGRIVSIPNGFMFSHPIYNYTRDLPLIWDEISILVTYESDADVAVELITEAANEVVGDLMIRKFDEYRDKMELSDLRAEIPRQPQVRMKFADSGVNLYVIYLCQASTRRRVHSEITKRIWSKFNQDERVEIAYPHTQILGGISTNGRSQTPISKEIERRGD
jgi:small-conductance mechanosensitive channel